MQTMHFNQLPLNSGNQNFFIVLSSEVATKNGSLLTKNNITMLVSKSESYLLQCTVIYIRNYFTVATQMQPLPSQSTCMALVYKLKTG